MKSNEASFTNKGSKYEVKIKVYSAHKSMSDVQYPLIAKLLNSCSMSLTEWLVAMALAL